MDSIQALSAFSASISVSRPSRQLNAFCGVMNIDIEDNDEEEADPSCQALYSSHHLGLAQFVPRGARLVNTAWMLGAVVAVGDDTKQLMNAKASSSSSSPAAKCWRRSGGEGFQKRSCFDGEVNRIVVLLLIILVFVCLLLATAHSLFCHLEMEGHEIYLGSTCRGPGGGVKEGVLDFVARSVCKSHCAKCAFIIV